MADAVCRYCNKPINFIPHVKNDGTKTKRPINPDGSRHVCPGESGFAGSWSVGEVGVESPGIKLAAPESEVQASNWDERINQANSTALSVVTQFAQLGMQFTNLESAVANKVGQLNTEFTKLQSTWADQLKSVQPVMVKTPTSEWKSTKRLHKDATKLYRRVLQVHGRGIVFLVGEPGSMKTSTIDPLANMLGAAAGYENPEEFPRYVISANNQMSRAELLGFLNGYGTYVETPIYQVGKHGGLLLIDEIDAGNANVLTALNTAATNEFIGFANGELVRKHKNCYIIAAGNTVGAGGTEEFIGRNQLDMATRTRFVMLRWDTDWDLVAHIVREQLGDDSWAKKVKLMHDIVQKRDVKFVVTTRVALIGASMLMDGESEETIWDEMLWPNISEDDRMGVESDYERMLEQLGFVKYKVDMSEFTSEEIQLLAKSYEANGKFGLGNQVSTLRPDWPTAKRVLLVETIIKAKGVTA